MLDHLLSTLGLTKSTDPPLNPSPFSSLLSHFPSSGSIPPSSPPNPSPLHSFWTANYQSPLSNRGEHDPLPEEADVVVIGSGLTGVCAVDQLVEELIQKKEGRKVKIVVLEAREFCSGATGQSKLRSLSAAGQVVEVVGLQLEMVDI